MDAAACRLCGTGVPVLLDLGALPFANRFAAEPDAATWPRRFGACPACGLAQLIDPAPVALLRPRIDWLAAKEPDGHLDGLADRLAALIGRAPDGAAGGLSAKDDPLLDRLAARGVATAWRLDPRRHLGLDAAPLGVESVQAALAAGAGADWPVPATLVVMRHLLEHAHQPAAVLTAAARLCAPDGRLLVEVPACEAELERGDDARLWEEHAQYFTAATLDACLRRCGWLPEATERHHHGGEDLLVVLARRGTGTGLHDPAPELERARAFAAGFPARRRRIHAALDAVQGPLALLGAGHLACTWAHAHGVAGRIALLLDDHPRKQGCRLPGLPAIAPSSTLAGSPCGLCLLAVPPESEERVAARLGTGVPLRSIFPSSPRHLLA